MSARRIEIVDYYYTNFKHNSNLIIIYYVIILKIESDDLVTYSESR